MNSLYTRVIKFKAWHRKRRKVYDVTHIRFHSQGRFTVKVGGEDAIFSDEDVELLQYTSLPDMHDQEIYEGYVVHDPENNQFYEVLYRADRYMVERRIISERNPGYELADLYPLNERVEVVGNIFEHRDLLEKVGYSSLTTDNFTSPVEEEDTKN